MNTNKEFIPFHLEMNRVIELLAKQIYQSPLALLRENCQNAFDAILMRKSLDPEFIPKIEISISTSKIEVSDNGIGMTKEELKSHFWRAGSSGKNNAEARAAGVVGTFGIGAMANFGVASEIEVITESAKNGERTRSIAVRDALSATEDCIEMETLSIEKKPGTKIIAKIQDGTSINIEEGKNYISQFVKYIDIPVYINDALVSTQSLLTLYPDQIGGYKKTALRESIGSALKCDIDFQISNSSDVSAKLDNIEFLGKPIKGILILKQGEHHIKGLRSQFLLATTAVSSTYGFGGIADLDILGPTAGREALTTASIQVLQTIVTEVEGYVSEHISESELVNMNTAFMQWVLNTNRFDLCGNLEIRLEPNNLKKKLKQIKEETINRAVNIYDGNEQTIIDQYSNDDSSLVIVSTRQPRRSCEINYLNTYCTVKGVSTAPTVFKRNEKRNWTLEESSLAFRLVSILSSDYFVEAEIEYGEISHKLPILVNSDRTPVEIVLNPTSGSISTILQVYKTEYEVIASLTKDFIRNVIFPKISNLVPSSTRQGAEAFLKSIRKPKDYFEYEESDLSSITTIWQDYLEGKLTLSQASENSIRYASQSVQIIDGSVSTSASSVIQDVLQNEIIIKENGENEPDEMQPLPAIIRSEIVSQAKLLTIDISETPLKGYRCFLALTETVREDRLDFFLQPHSTEIVWGGQKVLYVFQHHSKQFGLYYELQGLENVSETAGGQQFNTCTIVLKNQVYIPIPNEISKSFIPDVGKRKKFEVRSDFLYTDTIE
jgi:molecular chaperone HtpG